MLLIKLFSSFDKVARPVTKSSIFRYHFNFFSLGQKVGFSKIVDFNSQLKSDVVLFTTKRPRFFGSVYVFGGIQLIYWCGLSYAVINVFRNYEMQKPNSFFQRLFNKEIRYYAYFGAFFALIGILVFCTNVVFTLRLVESLTLHKGGMKVTITTHKFLGYTSKVEAPLRKVSAVMDRSKSKTYFPLKIQNKPFYFLMDINGDFKNPLLFDQTVGKKRVFY